MTWFKVDDGFPAHRKVEALQAMPPATYTAAITVWTLMGADCGLNLSDGAFSRVRARKITGLPDRLLDAAFGALTKVGLLHETADGFVYHEWDSMQPSRAKVEADRAAKVAAGRSGGVASGHSRAKQVLHHGEAGASVSASGCFDENEANGKQGAGEKRSYTRASPDPTRPDPNPNPQSDDTPANDPPPVALSTPGGSPFVDPSGASKSTDADDSKPSKAAKGKRSKVAPADVAPLPGTDARRVYDAIVGDAGLRPIVGNPGDAATRWTDPDRFAGVNVLAEVKAAADWLSRNPSKWRDGRSAVGGWLQRRANEVALLPKPASAPLSPRPIQPKLPVRTEPIEIDTTGFDELRGRIRANGDPS